MRRFAVTYHWPPDTVYGLTFAQLSALMPPPLEAMAQGAPGMATRGSDIGDGEAEITAAKLRLRESTNREAFGMHEIFEEINRMRRGE